jgi:hypothetical protein
LFERGEGSHGKGLSNAKKKRLVAL